MRQLFVVVCLAVALVSARWVREGRSDQPRDTSFIGDASSELSTAILQGYIDDNENIAFSPLGYSAILAILAEGAKGETREQLYNALHLPEDPALTRKTYQYIMERLKNVNTYAYNQPELKNFFYVYKNYTVNDEYRKILEEYYLTDVRSVEKYNPESDVHSDDDDDEEAIRVPEKTDEPSEPNEDMPIKTEPNEKLISFAFVDTPEKVDVTQIEYKPAKNIKEKIKLVKTYPKKEDYTDEEETMIAVEARNHARSLNVNKPNHDISSGFSVNSVSKKSSANKSSSVMIIFNGMYFRGSWKKPFDVVEPGLFYKSSSEKKSVQMMKATGSFNTAFISALDSQAICLPYDGGRYALLILVPRSRDGLTRLIADLPSVTLQDIEDSMKKEELLLSMPTFYVETTTKPIVSLVKFGVSKIFTHDADLSGVSSDGGLFVEEMAQHVSVRVDNSDSVASEMSAANVDMPLSKNLPLSEKPATKFSVDHPFVFFIMDTLDNLVVVAGKVVDPEKPKPFDF
ncbi:serpin B4 [Bombyx mandarina]|uniref:Serpin B4 n=1 Tax=Bombyx mandarina TaxID=7092 RepID=A0A6J2KMW3_BOMMA|nr:serpin B4 [Bombyx mandarina]